MKNAVQLKKFSRAIYTKRCAGNPRAPESLAAAARAIGISAGTLSRLERGTMPDLQTYVLVCRWLGAELSEFAG